MVDQGLLHVHPDMKDWPKLVAAYYKKAKYGYTLKAGETEAGPSRTRERGRTSGSGLARPWPWWRRSGQEELATCRSVECRRCS
jgi:hypothetical protein